MRVIAKAKLRAVDVGRDVTTTELFAAHFSRGPARVVEDAPRRLVVAGVAVATVGPDPSRLNPMCATSAEDMPVVEMLAAIAAQSPTGVLVIESADAQQGFAFEIVGGNVTGARGPGELGQLERWCAEVHRCYPDRFGSADRTDPLWIAVARAFVTERVLDHLALANSPGARLTFVRGDVQWNGTCLPEGKGVSLQHLLLEHARRTDELPRVLAKLGETSQLAVPLSEPSTKPTTPPKQRGRVDDGWDFFDDPDPAALEEWSDARLVWPLCDGQHSLDEIVDLALVGRFRGLAALAALRDRSHITLVDAAPAGVVELVDDAEPEIDPPSSVVPLRKRTSTVAPPPPPEEQRTEYSVVLRPPRPSTPPPVRVSPPPPPPTLRPGTTWGVPRKPAPPSKPASAGVEQAPVRARPRDVIDEMLADLDTPSPDDEPAFAAPLHEPTPPVAPTVAALRGGKAMKWVAMVIMGASLFVAGAGVALQVSRTHAVVDR